MYFGLYTNFMDLNVYSARYFDVTWLKKKKNGEENESETEGGQMGSLSWSLGSVGTEFSGPH